MHRRLPALFLCLSLGWSSPMEGQLPEWVNDILVATRLPVVADEARREGAASGEIREVLEAMSRARVPAHEATVILDSARAVRREHGPVDNFGAFVQTQLAEGKRGRELAAAIRAEHARRGKGNGGHGGQGSGRDRERDRNEAHDGRDDDSTDRNRKDRATRRNEPGSPGRADSARGRSDDRGQGRGRPGTPHR